MTSNISQIFDIFTLLPDKSGVLIKEMSDPDIKGFNLHFRKILTDFFSEKSCYPKKIVCTYADVVVTYTYGSHVSRHGSYLLFRARAELGPCQFITVEV